ncbi:hypothetical protein CPB85DRAFT_1232121, partial [Mucidula mucida]
SRDFLLLHHSNPSDPKSADAAFNVYQTLLFSTVAWWSTPKLTAESFSTFIQSVVDRLPSSSSTFPGPSLFGEQLVDMVWSIDTELEEIAIEHRPPNDKAVPTLEYKRVEADKQVLVDIVARLLVCLHVLINDSPPQRALRPPKSFRPQL